MLGLLGALGGVLFGSSAATAATIGAAGSLLGGALSAREQRKMIAGQNEYNDPAAIRARAERAGFNPLLFVGPGVGNQTSIGQPYMGSAIADASMLLADGFSKRKRSGAESQLRRENEKLRQELTQQTIRPKIGGVYAQRQKTPTMAEALGVSSPPSADGGDPYANADENRVRPVALGDVPQPDPFLDRGSGLYLNGHYYEGPPGWSSGQAIEDTFGDGMAASPAQSFHAFSWWKHNIPLMFQNQGWAAKVGPPRDDQPYIDAAKRAADVVKAKPKPKSKPKSKSKHPLSSLGF